MLVKPAFKYGFSVVAVAAALAIRLALDPWLGEEIPYGVFFLAVTVTAQFAGFLPAVCACFLSVFSCAWFFSQLSRPPANTSEELAGLAVFMLIGLVIARLGHLMQRGRLAAETAEQDWKETFDATPDLIAILDQDFRIVRANRAMAEALKLGSCDLPGRKCFDCVHRSDKPPSHCPHARTVVDGKEHSAEVHELDADFFVTCTPLFDKSGAIKGSVHVARNITERKKAEAAVERERNILQAVMNGAENVHLAYLDRDFNFVRVNSTYARSCGYRPDEMTGKNHFDLFPDAENEAIFAHVRDSGQPVECHDKPFQYPGQPQRGVTYWDWTLNPIKRHDGVTEALVLSLTETTERKRSEDELKLREERFRRLVEVSSEIVWVTDANGEVREDSPSWRAFTGCSLDELLGTNWFHAVHPDDREQLAEAWHHAVATRGVYAPKFRLRHHSGKYRHVQCRAVPVLNADGTVREWIGMNTDITNRIRAEVELKKQGETLREIFEGIYDGIIVHTLDGKIIDVNERYLAMYGLSRADAVNLTVQQISAPAAPLEKLPALWADVTQKGPRLFEWKARRPLDGSEFDVEVFLRKIHIHGEDLIMANLRDITDRKQREEQLKDADRRKDEFLAMLAHELRNPMAAISTAAALLSRPGVAEDKLCYAREALKNRVRQLSRLVDDLLDVSRITRGKVQLKKELLDLAAVIQGAVETTRSLFEEAQQQLTVRVTGELPVFGDRVRLEQAVTNLLTNAARYSEKQASVTVTASREDGLGSIRVHDTGSGIPPELLPKIFDLFEQADTSLHRSGGGLGVGLTIAKKIIELHGGVISARSDGPGKGSEFELLLPLSRAASAAPAPAKPEDRVEAGLNILIVEDHKDTALFVSSLLQLEGHRTEIASDGYAGVEAAMRFKPDVLLLDIGLPGLTGFEVAKRVRESGLDQTLIIAVSGYGQARDFERSREAGIDHHLLKPLDLEKLAPLLAAWQKKRRRQAEPAAAG